jgi:hypothetical protein
MEHEIVYLGHDNRIDIILKADGSAVDLSSVTRMTLSFDSLLIDSDNGDLDPIQWVKAGYVTGEVRISLGGQSIPAGDYRAALVVYDPSNPNGIVWGLLLIQIEAEVEAE